MYRVYLQIREMIFFQHEYEFAASVAYVLKASVVQRIKHNLLGCCQTVKQFAHTKS